MKQVLSLEESGSTIFLVKKSNYLWNLIECKANRL